MLFIPSCLFLLLPALLGHIASSAQRLPYAPFQADSEQFLGFNGKFHWKMLKYFFSISIHDKADGAFGPDTPLVAIEKLVIRDL